MGPDYGAALLTPAGRRDPYPVYSILRSADPVHWSELLQAWLVAAHADVRSVFRDRHRYSSVGRRIPGIADLPPGLRERLPLAQIVESSPALDSADPPQHTNQRAQVMRPLASRKLAALEPVLLAECESLADGLARVPEPDLVEHFSSPLAHRAVLGVLGLPPDLASIYRDTAAARQALSVGGGTDPVAALRYEGELAKLREAIGSASASLDARDAGSSVLASLLHPAPPRTPLPPDELFAVLMTFLGAAVENLVYSIPATILALLEHPEQLALVRASPAAAAPAYEEGLRWNVPAHANRRRVRIELDLGGKALRPGEEVLVFKASANRDPAAWDEPDRFDILRPRPADGGLSFGQGLHFCSGAGFARLVGPLAIAAVVRRYPRLALHEGWTPEWRDMAFTRMLVRLPVRL